MAEESQAGGIDNLLLTSKVNGLLHRNSLRSRSVSCFVSGGGRFDEILFFGLQLVLKRWLVGQVVTERKIEEAKSVYREFYGENVFDEDAWKYILECHAGHLPIRVKAVREGLILPCQTVLFTIESTDPKCTWLTAYLEDVLFQVWFPLTVATNSYHRRKTFSRYLDETGDGEERSTLKLFDYGFKEASSVEASGVGGLAHLVNFRVTENTAALMTSQRYYHCHGPCSGNGIPGTDHNSMTTWGRKREVESYRNVLDHFQSLPLMVVSDAYDIYRACEELWGEELREDLVMRSGSDRTGNGLTFIRSDSGKIPDIIVKLLEILGRKFGFELNSRGFRRLRGHIRLIHSSWIYEDTLEPILERLKTSRWSAENVAFGSDGEMTQYVTNDAQRCHYVYGHVNSNRHSKDLLTTVFENGKLLYDYTLEDIRINVDRQFPVNGLTKERETIMTMTGAAVDNIILCADSYKVTHHLQYPPNTTFIYSYFESRGGKFDKTLFFGLQYILKRWLVGPVVTEEKIAEAKSIFQDHYGQDVFNEEGWRYIVEKHNGHLPLRIKAVPEGMVVPFKNVLFTVENTDPQCFWLTNYVETLLVQAWYPITVATNSFYQKVLLAKYLSETADNLDGLLYQLHDFGYRGVSSVESAGIGGAAHLVNFRGTDTVAALMTARKFYGCQMAGNSIPAAEHSTITTWGRDREKQAFQNMMERIPNGAISVVSDSYNVYEACKTVWGKALKDCVVERGNRNGRVVIRPDSGEPEKVVVEILDILGERFGFEKNTKGYRVLPSYIRLIQGDGISYDSLPDILERVKKSGWSTENVVFGSGGALLQRLDRDTQKCAYKCSSAVINGEMVNVFKEPVTDMGKKSKRGRLRLVRQGDTYVTEEQCPLNPKEEDSKRDVLVTVFENGKLTKDYSFSEIRSRADQECQTQKHNKKL